MPNVSALSKLRQAMQAQKLVDARGLAEKATGAAKLFGQQLPNVPVKPKQLAFTLGQQQAQKELFKHVSPFLKYSWWQAL